MEKLGTIVVVVVEDFRLESKYIFSIKRRTCLLFLNKCLLYQINILKMGSNQTWIIGRAVVFVATIFHCELKWHISGEKESQRQNATVSIDSLLRVFLYFVGVMIMGHSRRWLEYVFAYKYIVMKWHVLLTTAETCYGVFLGWGCDLNRNPDKRMGVQQMKPYLFCFILPCMLNCTAQSIVMSMGTKALFIIYLPLQ